MPLRSTTRASYSQTHCTISPYLRAGDGEPYERTTNPLRPRRPIGVANCRSTHEGIDCSALTQNSYGENRVKIPRVSREQWKTGSKTESLREGDLIFFNTMGAGVSHVAMVTDAKNKKFIHASSSKGVMIADLNNKWFGQRYLGARRVVP